MNLKLIYSANSLNELCLSTDSTQLWLQLRKNPGKAVVMSSGEAAIPEPRTGRLLSGKPPREEQGIEARPPGPPSREEAKPGFSGCSWC